MKADTKRERGFRGSYVDMEKETYKLIGVLANWYARFDIPDNEEMQDMVSFTPLNNVFKTGYLSMDHYVCKIKDSDLIHNPNEEVSFSISVNVIRLLLPNWEEELTMNTEFL